MNFKKFLIKNENKDIEKTLEKIPESHRKLIKNYKIIFQGSNLLKNGEKNVGFIDEENKTITISAPWNYSREFVLLHEIAHVIWKYVILEEQKAEWKKIFNKVKNNNKKDLDQNAEEIFCHSYAQAYTKNKLEKFDHNELVNFIKMFK